MTAPFTRFVCWKQARIGAVINKEALSVDRADFLATHVPMREIAYERSPHAIASTGEDELLSELLHHADTDQHTFVIIKGVPGTGKSHLIRWLKERYAAKRTYDVVILIERANTSLRGTLQQIINSGVFERAGLPESLQRLQEAVTELSADALADNLIDQIKTATREVQYEGLPKRWSPEKVEAFLLDLKIREQLKLPAGPLERIASFLAQGRQDNSGIDKSPGFEASDFEFAINVITSLNGYPEAKAVAQDLHEKANLRETMARYLNTLLRTYAITRATRLSAQDLREMFNDLRRELQKLDLQLALFIEDITAFTGIDEGLLDVLITQHRGETNTAFCRLTSVVGVTDAYFSDLLPDNIKQRATHQLTLSSQGIRGESDLLQDASVRREFASRYLNAMRHERSELEQWVRSGASPQSLPNACEPCPFREPCHAAFGAVAVDDDDHSPPIGLYPFNGQAIDALFYGLRDAYPRTPRTFLFDIMAYILQSHGADVELGKFPPAETELAQAVRPPSFSPPAHRQIVEKQAGHSAARASTLLLFWGDRSAERSIGHIGSVSQTVFSAFGIRPIAGVSATAAAVPVSAPAPPTAAANVEEAKVTREQDRFTHLIDDWMTTGRLGFYDRFAEWMADLVRSHIDWQAHGISLAQVKEYITQGRFEIEGQTGVAQRQHRIFFARTPELRYVLQALADLNVKGRGLTAAQYGEYLATLSSWVRSEEARIVAYVREPSGLNPPADYLLKALARNAVALAGIEGHLRPEDDLIKQYYGVIAACAENADWAIHIERCKPVYPRPWIDLMREVNVQKAVSVSRTALLQLLNRPQGRSDSVRYVDAAALLTLLDEMRADEWAMPELTYTPQTTDFAWSAAMTVRNALSKSFAASVESCYAEIGNLSDSIMEVHGESSPSDVLTTMGQALEVLRNSGLPYPSALDTPFTNEGNSAPWTDKRLKSLLKGAADVRSYNAFERRALYVSTGYATDAPKLREWLKIVESFMKEMQKKSEYLDKKIIELSAESDVSELVKRTEREYEQLAELVRGMTEAPHV